MMTRSRTLWLGIALAGCGRVGFEHHWTKPELQPTPGAGSVDDPTLTADQLELFFNANTAGSPASVWENRRTSPTAEWMPSTPAIPGGMNFYSPHISDDGLTMWGADVDVDIAFCTRATRDALFGPPTKIPEVSSSSNDDGTMVTSDQLTMVFDSQRTGAFNLYMSTRPTTTSAWSTPLSLDIQGARPFLSADGLSLYFERADDLYVAHRRDPGGPFGEPEPLDEINTPMIEQDAWLSPDERQLLFASDRESVGIALQVFETFR